MKTVEQVREEIAALRRLAEREPDEAARASIAGQINALAWATGFEVE